jgi:SAM-dependent methyltransferase
MDELPKDVARWDEFYRTHSFSRESTFARFVQERFPHPATVIELGCGDGRDSVFFARQGKQVVAVDRAPNGIGAARAKLGFASELSFVVGDVSDAILLATLFRDPMVVRAGASLIVYMRFFLHAVPLETENVILDALGAYLPAGVHLAVEFRTDRDASLPKAEGVHFRRFIAADDLIGRLEQRGYSILHSEAGHGLSVYRDEDPHLARIVARRNA